MPDDAISRLVGVDDDTPEKPQKLEEAPKNADEDSDSPLDATSETPVAENVQEVPATSTTLQVNEPDPTAPAVDAVMEALKRTMGTTIGESSSCKVVLYSEPGKGKSSIAATVPNSLLWDFEDGLMSAAESPHGISPGIVPMKFVNFIQAEALITKFEERHPDLDWCEVFTIDTYSDFVRRTLADICERDWRNAPSVFNRYKPNTDQYTENNEMHDRFVRRLRDLDRDLLILTHEKTVEPKGKPAKTYPDFSESFANKLEAKMDVVGHCTMEEIDGESHVVMLTKSTSVNEVHCKSRIDLPVQMIDPTWPQIKAGWLRTQAKIKAMQEAQNGTPQA